MDETEDKKPEYTLTEYPLGILLGRGIITLDQHNQGCHYAWLYGKVTGRKSVAAVVFEETGGFDEDASEKEAARRMDLFRSYADALMSRGRRCKDLFDNLVVYGRQPHWVQPHRFPTQADYAEARLLMTAFAILEERFIRGKKAA